MAPANDAKLRGQTAEEERALTQAAQLGKQLSKHKVATSWLADMIARRELFGDQIIVAATLFREALA